MFQYTLNNLRNYKDANHSFGVVRSMKISNEEYTPFYSLGFTPPTNLPVSRILTEDYEPDLFDSLYGIEVTSSPTYLKFLKECIDKKYYGLLFLCAPTGEIGNRLLSLLRSSFDSLVSRPFNVQFTTNMVHIGNSPLQDIFDRSRLLNRWATSWYKFRKLDAKTYLSNIYFLAEMPGKVSGVVSATKVLFTVMVKRADLPVIRAHFATNTPIPSSLLELWIDNSVEDVGSNIKPYFRKYIKAKFQAAGVSMKYFDNLNGEIISTHKMPVLNTIRDRVEWEQSKLEEWYECVEGKLIIRNSTPIVLPSQIDSLRNKFIAMAREVCGIVEEQVDGQAIVTNNSASSITLTTNNFVTYDRDSPF